MAERLFMAPVMSFAPLKMKPSDYAKTLRTSWSGLKRELPANVHLLTLEEFGDDSYLLRLEHFYEKNEDSTLSKDATVSLKVHLHHSPDIRVAQTCYRVVFEHFQDLFAPFEIDSAVELTLGANEKLDGASRLAWNVEGMGRTNTGTTKTALFYIVISLFRFSSFFKHFRHVEVREATGRFHDGVAASDANKNLSSEIEVELIGKDFSSCVAAIDLLQRVSALC